MGLTLQIPHNDIQNQAPVLWITSTGAPLTLAGIASVYFFFQLNQKISQTAGMKHTLGDVGQIQSVSSPDDFHRTLSSPLKHGTSV